MYDDKKKNKIKVAKKIFELELMDQNPSGQTISKFSKLFEIINSKFKSI